MTRSANPWKTKSIHIPYENAWLQIEHHEVVDPSGGDGIYGVVRFKNRAIGIVPLDEEDHTYLIGQWRYPLEAYHWEIPEGGCPPGEDPLDTAKRELKEETGLTAQNWTPLLSFHLSNSVTDEWGQAFLAQGLSAGDAEPEQTEDLTLRRVHIDDAIAMVMRGEITDAVSIMALQRVALMRTRG